MPDEYTLHNRANATCNRNGAPLLQSYRDKRRLWLSWISTDEHHAIWTVLSSMVWTDVSFKVLTHFAVNDENNGAQQLTSGRGAA